MEKEILEKLLTLLYKYSKTPRATVTRERYDSHLKAAGSLDMKDLTLREPLIEHVGQLPIITAFLHPYLQQKDEVDLKETLAMLAIHDIAETELGDQPFTFKEPDTDRNEETLTPKLIDSSQLTYYQDLINLEKRSALFAKAVDSMTPFLNDMLLPPRVTQARLDCWGYDIEKVKKGKEKYFSWDSTLKSIFELLMHDYDLRKNGETNFNLDFL